MAEFLNEQNQKQAELKRKRSGDQRVETSETSVQCHISSSPRSTADASVQTDHYDVTTEFRQQILNLTEVVKQLTALRCLHQHEPKPAALPLFDEDSDFPTLDSEAVASLMGICSSPTVQTSQETGTSSIEPSESQRPVLSTFHQIHRENLSPVFPPQLAPPRPPLQPVDQNVIPLASSSHGPTDEQRTKVTSIVAAGNDMSTAALACVDVLFTEEEMARCNTSGTKGFQQLDSAKLGFLVSVLQRKFDSTCFSEQWNQIAVRINTKCRGKRRTLIHRLKKTSLFGKH